MIAVLNAMSDFASDRVYSVLLIAKYSDVMIFSSKLEYPLRYTDSDSESLTYRNQILFYSLFRRGFFYSRLCWPQSLKTSFRSRNPEVKSHKTCFFLQLSGTFLMIFTPLPTLHNSCLFD